MNGATLRCKYCDNTVRQPTTIKAAKAWNSQSLIINTDIED